MKKILVTSWILLSMCFLPVLGQVDSQWRGPNRDGVYPNEKLLQQWPKEGPEMLWFVEGLGRGYSSPAVTSDRVYLTGENRGEGFLFAYDKNGKLLWKTSYGPEWDGSRPGARTTPTVVGNRIYVMSAEGHAVCLSTDGNIVWTVDLNQEFGARNIEWGMTESPLVDGDRVYFTPGGRGAMVVALDRNSGETIWKAKGNGQMSGYCSPCLIQHGGKKLLITMTAKSVVGLDADTGEYLWNHSHRTSYDVNANTPFYHQGHLYTVSGYGTGGQMFKLSEDGKSISKVWAQKTLDSQMGSSVFINGYIYGSGHNNRGWHCLDWKTGEVQFTARKVGNKGNIIFTDGMLYCYSERGDVALVKPNPQEFEVISSFRLKKGTGEHWAHLVINQGRLYVRHGDALMVYSISQ